MNRQIHEMQTGRSDIWEGVFYVPTQEEVASSSFQPPPAVISLSMDLPTHPHLMNATVIQTNLNTPTATSPPCNAKNRKTWTQGERKKAFHVRENIKSFSKEVGWPPYHLSIIY